MCIISPQISVFISCQLLNTHCRFEEKSEVMDQLDHQLRRLHSSTEALFEYRRALANSTGSLSRYKILGLVIYRVIHLP